MATEKQIEANRENSRQSTGPNTEEGKARSSQNALIHGLLSKQRYFWDDETREQFADLVANYVHELKPQGQPECDAVEKLVATEMRLVRIRCYEEQLFDAAFGPDADDDPDASDAAMKRLQVLHRYAQSASRDVRESYAELRRLQANRLPAEEDHNDDDEDMPKRRRPLLYQTEPIGFREIYEFLQRGVKKGAQAGDPPAPEAAPPAAK